MGDLPKEYVTLDETQKKVDIRNGSPLVLYCGLKIQNNERVRITWYFNPSGPFFEGSINLTDRIITQTNNNTSKKTNQDSGVKREEYFISLFNVAHNNSGWYFCKVTVEIPMYICLNSSGTQVNVTCKYDF